MLLRRNVKLVVEDGAKEFILEKGISPEFGAREIDRVIRNEVKPLLVDELLFGTAKDGGSLRISLVDGKLAAEAQSKEQE